MLKHLTPTLLLATIVVGCAKEKPYESLYKEPETISRSEIKINQLVVDKDTGKQKLEPIKYLYVPMTLGTPREVVAAMPFYQGDEKVVQLQWSKNGLEVVDIEDDERFSDNELNATPVLTIPGEYIDYQCAEDEFGDCTNKEETVDDVAWDAKGQFKPDYAGLEVQEVNMLDASNVDQDSCVSQIGSKVRDYEISDGVINIELEKTYRVQNSWRCLWRQYVEDKFPYNAFKVRFFYSMVQLDKLTTPGYQPIDYPVADHDEFGFFETESNTLEDHFDSQRKVKKHLVNRWAPNRKNNELVYHLSKNFNEKSNKVLLDATFEAFEVMNKGLEAANSPFRLVAKPHVEGTKEKSPGDLRYNTVVLIEDPLANGLLGYGPSVANPYTGEIVQAHTNMYGGVLKSIVRRVYESAVDLTEEKLNKSDEVIADMKVSNAAYGNVQDFIVKANNPEGIDSAPTQQQGKKAKTLKLTSQAAARISNIKNRELSKAEIKKQLQAISTEQLELIKAPKVSMNDHVSELDAILNNDHEDSHMDELDHANFLEDVKNFSMGSVHKHKPEFFPIGGTTKVVYPELLRIENILTANNTLKRWAVLTEAQKDAALNVILKKSWISTLVHELGHNLGLRHNFKGSYDKENFFTKEEANELGYEDIPAYSSVMDYSYSKYNQLRSFGKYDIAALKYAYAREIEVEMIKKTFVKDPNGNTSEKSIDVLKTETMNIGDVTSLSITEVRDILDKKNEVLANSDIDEEKQVIQYRYRVKPYAFCTDGHAGLSSSCNRFDEGTSLTEIAKHRVENYNRLYKYRNFRDGRIDYSAYDVPSYIYSRNREFGQIRDIFEEVEFYSKFWSMDLLAQGCGEADLATYPEQCTIINDASGALNVVANHFIDILKTPDHTCAIAKADDPKTIVKFETLYDLNNTINLKYRKKDVIYSCFEDTIKDFYAAQEMIVVGENGKFLNGFKGVDKEFKYVTDRAVLGTWPDKLMAIKQLFKRKWRNRTTDSDHFALVDIPAVRQKVIDVLVHYITGDVLVDPIPFKTETGAKFQVPYIISDNYLIEQIEGVFGQKFKASLGLEKDGETYLLKALLSQISKIGTDYGVQAEEKAYLTNNIATVRRYDRHMYGGDLELVYIKSRDFVYAADENSPIAQFMIDSIVFKDELDQFDRKVIAKVVAQRENPEAPAELTDSHKAFYNLDAQWQVTLINLYNRGTRFEVSAFVNQFGAELGPLLHATYVEGSETMQGLVDLKKELQDTVPADATEVEKKLYTYPVFKLVRYMDFTDAEAEYYKKKLKILPNYVMDY